MKGENRSAIHQNELKVRNTMCYRKMARPLEVNTPLKAYTPQLGKHA